MTRTLVVQTAYLGDVVLTTPLLEALAARHGPVDVVTTPAAVPLLATHPAVSAVLPFAKRAGDRGLRGLLRMAVELRRRVYDVAYLPHESLRSALLARLAGIPRRVGFAGAPGTALYTDRRPRPRALEHQRLASLAGPPAIRQPRLFLTQDDRRRAAEALTASGVAEPFVVLAPGSARATKRWPYYRELALRLARLLPVVIVGERRDRLFALEGPAVPPPRRLAAPPPHRPTDLCGMVTIREAAAVIERASLAITNDSAPMHIAAAVGTPVVAIFGPTHPDQGFAPYAATGDRGPGTGAKPQPPDPRPPIPDPAFRAVQLDGVPCRPCSRHGGARCPLGHHQCMRGLPVDAVIGRCRTVLGDRLNRQPTTDHRQPFTLATPEVG